MLRTTWLVSLILLPGLATNCLAIEEWWDQDIGTTGGSVTEGRSGRLIVVGDGADIWGSSDGFHYVYKILQGDGSVTARVLSQQYTNEWAKAGVMIRETLQPGSKHCFMAITPTASHGVAFQSRTATGSGSCYSADHDPAVFDSSMTWGYPYWVRLVREAGRFTGYVSKDGVQWRTVLASTDGDGSPNPQINDMTDRVYIGLAVTSHAQGILCQVQFDAISHTGNVTSKPTELKASQPNPAHGTIDVALSMLQWKAGTTAVSHNVYLGTTADLTAADLCGAPKSPLYYHTPGFASGVTYYWRVDEVAADGTVYQGDVWSFTTESLAASAPKPADNAVVPFPVLTLKWTPARGALQHQVYFSSSFADVYRGTGTANKGRMTSAAFKLGLLRSCTTYYWRVDELKSNGTTERGRVWSFTTADAVTKKIIRQWWLNIPGTIVPDLTRSTDYPDNPTGTALINLFEGPTDWADDYGSRLCGWLLPPASGQYTFWIASDDFSELWLSSDTNPANVTLIASVLGWTPSRDFDNNSGAFGGPTQKSQPIYLQANQKYFIQALMKEGVGGDNLAVAWQPPGMSRDVIEGRHVDTFALLPTQAFSPKPAHGAVDVVPSVVLSWSASAGASQYDVYFGEDQAAVATSDSTTRSYKGRQTGATFNPGTLAWNRTYYWRIDEIQASNPQGPSIGAVWSFSTANFISIDDFEKYTGDEGNRIYETWVDGWLNATGATAGYRESPYAEQKIVHGGKQSMPLSYDNARWPWYSETEREFATPQDWTANGINALTLYFQGQSSNSKEKLYVAITDSSEKMITVVHADPQAVLTTAWTEWKIPLSSFTGVNVAKVRKMYLGVGDRKYPTPTGSGRVYIDDIRLTRP